MTARANILSMEEAERPEFTTRQMDFAKELVGIGLTHLTIIGLVIGEDVAKLNHAHLSSGRRLIAECSKELGYGVMDARRAQSPFTAQAVKAASRDHRIKVRIA